MQSRNAYNGFNSNNGILSVRQTLSHKPGWTREGTLDALSTTRINTAVIGTVYNIEKDKHCLVD